MLASYHPIGSSVGSSWCLVCSGGHVLLALCFVGLDLCLSCHAVTTIGWFHHLPVLCIDFTMSWYMSVSIATTVISIWSYSIVYMFDELR